MLSDGARKIPSACCACGERLSRADMELFLDVCERNGRDPVEVAFARRPPGCLCLRCMTLVLAERADDGDPGAIGVVAKMRNLYQLGTAELPDGKPPVWH